MKVSPFLFSKTFKMLNYNPTSFDIKAKTTISYQSKRRNKLSTCLLHKQKVTDLSKFVEPLRSITPLTPNLDLLLLLCAAILLFIHLFNIFTWISYFLILNCKGLCTCVYVYYAVNFVRVEAVSLLFTFGSP